MTLDQPTLAYRRSLEDVMRTPVDRHALKLLRRRIRVSRYLDDHERADPLEQAKWMPGCVVRPLMVKDDGTTRPMTDEEIRLTYGPANGSR